MYEGIGLSLLSISALTDKQIKLICLIKPDFYDVIIFHRMPVQYILGEWDFHLVTLKMCPPVFIPRPETEQLVEIALSSLQGIKKPRVLEIGCGCGAISLALLHSIKDVS